MVDVAGYHPYTTIDFPGKTAAVIFLRGCPLNCTYCHNKQTLDAADEISWDWVMNRLRQRQGKLQGVVFSGGEPLAQNGLDKAILQVKNLGFDVGLHTSGYSPTRLSRLLVGPAKPDWVGLDIKGFEQDYEQVTGVAGAGPKAFTSLVWLNRMDVLTEVRTTLPNHWTWPWLQNLAVMLKGKGVSWYAVQNQQRSDVPGLNAEQRTWMRVKFDRFEYRA